MKHTLPSSLRKPEQRHAARTTADAIIRADNARRRRATAMPKPTKKAEPTVMVGPQRLHLSDLKKAFAARERLQHQRAKAQKENHYHG